MTPDQQEAYDLQQSGLTRQQIADQLGISVSSVKSRLERARKWLAAPDGQRAAISASGLDIERAKHGWRVVQHEDGSRDSVFWKSDQDVTDDIIDRVKDAFSDVPAHTPVEAPTQRNNLLTVYPLMDAHFGMKAWGKETGYQDYDLHHAANDMNNAFNRLFERTPLSDTAILILGGDTLHADDNNHETPKSKHKLDVDGRLYKTSEVAIHSICNAIDALCARHAKVIVRVLMGNHDPNAHLILQFALSARYREADNVNVESAERDLYWYRHGKSLIAAHHGDKAPAQRLCMVLADSCPEWSMARDRHVLTGHIHHDSVKDFPGVKWWSLRAFCPADEYGSTFGPRRALQALTFCDKDGLVLQGIEPIWRGK